MRKLRLAFAIVLAILLLDCAARAQARREIRFPDLPGYQTIKCDFHTHTVFSDGEVWPSTRVKEAWRQGLDLVAVTDHIEYQPHKDDVPTNHNRPYDLAAGSAKQMNLLLPKGAEITRDTPPGHFNAIFLNDVNPLDTKELADAIKQANEQKAFVFWNHQGWKGPEKGQWLDIHTTLYDNKWLHGMEVCNGDTYYPDAHAWCLQRNLTMLGDSDIHEPERKEESAPGDHRTMTLVFAKDRTLEGVKEALTERRTAVWFQDQVIGRRELLEPLFRECVRVARPHLRSKNALWVEIRNVSDVNIVLQQSGSLGPSELKLPAGAVSLVKIDVDASTEPAVLSYTAANFLIAPNQGLPVTLPIAK